MEQEMDEYDKKAEEWLNSQERVFMPAPEKRPKPTQGEKPR